MKKFVALLLVSLLLGTLFVSCGPGGNGGEGEETTADDVKVNVTVNVIAGGEKILDGVVVTLRDAENLFVLAALKQACYAYDIVYDIDDNSGVVNTIGEYTVSGGTIVETNEDGEEVTVNTDIYYWDWSLNGSSKETRANVTAVKDGDTVTYSYIIFKENNGKK